MKIYCWVIISLWCGPVLHWGRIRSRRSYHFSWQNSFYVDNILRMIVWGIRSLDLMVIKFGYKFKMTNNHLKEQGIVVNVAGISNKKM